MALPTPPAAGTRLLLVVEGGPLRATTPKGGGQTTVRPGTNGTNRIEVHGVGDQLDLSWRTTATANDDDTVLASSIAISASKVPTKVASLVFFHRS